jgi:hypothetical protein
MSKTIPAEVSFVHVVLEGTPYEVGRQQGEMLKDDPECARYLTPTLPFLAQFSGHEARIALEYFEKHCPGLREEIQGAADAFGIPVEDVAFLGGKSKTDGSSPIPVGGGHCSHFAVLPSISADGHLYAGQNVDIGLDDMERRLCTTRIQGKAAHIGFSDMIFGRSQGMNEHGLCVTTSWGAPGVWLAGEGLPYFAVVRAVLERCTTVDDALDVIAGLPIAWCTNYIIADRSGEAALVEVANAHRAVKRIGPESGDQFLHATNHYTLPQMIPYDTARRRESVARHHTIRSRLQNAAPHVTKDTIRDILSEPVPEGVCMRYYAAGLGTMWSMIFDVTDPTVEVCFGGPASPRNTWRSLGWDEAKGVTLYRAHLPHTPTPPEIWTRLSPGG